MQQPLAYLSLSKVMTGSLCSSITDTALSMKVPMLSSTSGNGNFSCKLLMSCLMRPSSSWVSAGDGDRLALPAAARVLLAWSSGDPERMGRGQVVVSTMALGDSQGYRQQGGSRGGLQAGMG